MPALTQSIKFTMRETGFTRGIGTWLKVNEKDGFDCQSCAWPSPDDHRHIFEFCENGVKALASEATWKHIGPESSGNIRSRDLSKQSDYWLELQGRLIHPMVKQPGATHYEPKMLTASRSCSARIAFKTASVSLIDSLSLWSAF
jgi:hypothetical protein